MICPSCDTPNRDDAKFCKKCGHAFRTTDAKVPEAASVSQASTTAPEDVSLAEDPSLAPTQIISPQKMLAFHANRWQKEQEAAPTNAQSPSTMTQEASDEDDMPTPPSTH